MSVEVKICGLKDNVSVAAAVDAGARYTGFVFYRKSPRFVGTQQAAALIERVPAAVIPVGLFVDPGDEEIAEAVRNAGLRAVQLHGNETPQRVALVRQMTGLPVIKAVGIAAQADLAFARSYESVADFLMLDAKPVVGDLPGGNGAAFDWGLLKGAAFSRPWFLAGGLNPDNVVRAIAQTGAKIVDVSSGVEDAPGVKNPAKIRAFIAATQK